MYFKLSLSAGIYDSCSLIFRFISGFFWGTTFVTRLMSQAGMDLNIGFSHFGNEIYPESVLRLKASLLRR